MVQEQVRKEKLGGPDSIMQDNVQCPRKPQWDPKVSRITGPPFMLILILGIYISFTAGIPELVIWLLAYVIFAYPLRYLICARCPYYGMDCSSGSGRLVTRMFKKQEGKSMKLGLWLDVLALAFLFVFPLFYIEGLALTIVWCGVFFLALFVLTRFGCSVCPFTFCPIGKGGRVFRALYKMSK